jgi:hypothetical protein
LCGNSNLTNMGGSYELPFFMTYSLRFCRTIVI